MGETGLHGYARLRPQWVTRPNLLAIGAALAVLIAAFAGAWLERGGGQLPPGESLASSAAGVLDRLGTWLPFGYSFAAGMVAAVNPCGFALLPAYIGLYLRERSPEALPRRLLRAVVISLVVSSSFILLFGAAGLVLSVVTSGLVRYLPWIGLIVGAGLVAAGAAMIAGFRPNLIALDRLGDRAGATARGGGITGYAAFGVAYAAGSLGCTLPVFLSVVAAGMTSRGPTGALLQFVLYGLGMGAVLSGLTVTTAVIGHATGRGLRRVGAYIQPMGAVVLLLAGGFVVYYWLLLGDILPRTG
jgi:cytochrome c-type biogenesis protein